MSRDPRSTDKSRADLPGPVDRGRVSPRAGERFLLGALIGLALALVLSGAANIALARDGECRQARRIARWGSQIQSCFSDVTYWGVDAVARGPAAAGEPEGGSVVSWLSVPLVYALLGGLVGQLPLRRALVVGLILQLLITGILAAMAFIAVYVG